MHACTSSSVSICSKWECVTEQSIPACTESCIDYTKWCTLDFSVTSTGSEKPLHHRIGCILSSAPIRATPHDMDIKRRCIPLANPLITIIADILLVRRRFSAKRRSASIISARRSLKRVVRDRSSSEFQRVFRIPWPTFFSLLRLLLPD